MTPTLRLLTAQLLGRALAHPKTRQALDWRFGLSLLLDREVPTRAKARAFGLGFAAFLVLEIAQMPLQAALYLLLPLLGFAADTALDGLELLIVPFLVAVCALPFLAPRDLVEAKRENRKGGASQTDENGRLYEAKSATVR